MVIPVIFERITFRIPKVFTGVSAHFSGTGINLREWDNDDMEG